MYQAPKPISSKQHSKLRSQNPSSESYSMSTTVATNHRRGLSRDDNDEQDDDECDCKDESNTGRTRSQQPELLELSTPTHSRRPKLYPSLTPWGDYWNYRNLNDFYPEKAFKWDNSDVPDFDLGEPMDETNFWEEPWIAATEKKKKVRDKREKQRKRRQRYGGLTAEERKRAYRRRIGLMRENGIFIRSRIVGGS
jgi:hypothetical protein